MYIYNTITNNSLSLSLSLSIYIYIYIYIYIHAHPRSLLGADTAPPKDDSARPNIISKCNSTNNKYSMDTSNNNNNNNHVGRLAGEKR